ncbi:glycine cleavage system transcriptional regulator GcvA [Pigmentiphaga soli]|uniref:Glycine cleavage system transcriptional regulator GcvA n=1 Tax=Pigmentiphaga soli TaxID=1007095 RepID=A0ABP8GL95_9BURK
MPGRRLPPLNALRAFEAAARHQSISRASEELSVTHGAISRQVAKLEEFLGAKLFVRLQQHVMLTERGAAYAAKLQTLFDQLEHITCSSFDARSQQGTLRIGVFSTFALRFLIPRLAGFRQKFPNLTVHVESSGDPIDPHDMNVDAAIWWGYGDWRNLVVEHLFDEEVVPVGSPALLAGRTVAQPDDLRDFLLLHAMRRPDDWQLWLQAVGATRVDGHGGLKLENSSLVYEAAVNGLGLAMAQTLLIREDIAHKRLMPAIELPVRTGRANYLVYPEAKMGLKQIALFSQWIKAEIAAAMLPQAAAGRQKVMAM